MPAEDEAQPDLAALVARVEALEAAVGSGTDAVADVTSHPDPQARFWVLEGLRRQLADGVGGVVYAGVVPTGEGEVSWQYGHPSEELLDADEERREVSAERLSALGSPVRLRLLSEVLAGTDTVVDLTSLPAMGTKGQVYHHVRALTAAGWLRSAGRGRLRVPADRVVPLALALAAVH